MLKIFKGTKFPKRYFSTLKETLQKQIPIEKEKIKMIKKDYGEKIIDQVTVNKCLNGSRDIKSIFWEPSLLDANKGICFRNYSLEECQEKLPKFKKDGEIIPEAMFWLLITGKIPSDNNIKSLRKELFVRSYLDDNIIDILKSLPKDTHPMTAFSLGIMLCQRDSHFKKAYENKVSKEEYWEYAYNDIINIIAKIPLIASTIYRNKYYNDYNTIKQNKQLDYSANFCTMLGFDDEKFHELMRLYLSIHSDHEGGNASAHTTHLVGSTLADPYLSYASGMNALAGPLHGSANSEVLKWIIELKKNLEENGKNMDKKSITEFVEKTLENGNVIPGYGHAVLRVTDPRYECQRKFALKYLPEDDLFKVIETLYQVVPDILKKQGKVKNPYPNVDNHSGVLLWHYNMREYEFYTVLFAMSRSLGVLSQYFWDRALNMPIERPKSINTTYINDFCKQINIF